jgi:hypothetical protein
MTFASRQLSRPIVAAVMSAAFVVACSSASPSVTPSPLATPVATATPVVTPTAAATPTAAPPTPTPASSAVASAAASPAGSTAACAPLPPALTLPSDRFTDLQVVPGDTTDTVRFVFGEASLPGPKSPPTGTLTVAKPPYTKAGSGAKIAVQGEHVLQLTFNGMSLQNDAGQLTYDGPTDIKQTLPAFQHAALYDASEGVIGWYIGYNGDGCVSLINDGNSLLLTIGQR